MFACLIPVALGFGALISYLVREGRAQIEKDTILTARALAQTFDGELAKVRVMADALASSAHLENKDFSAFHRRASQLLAKQGIGSNVTLSDNTAQLLLNTLRTYGEVLPRHGNPTEVQHIFETGRPAVSGVFVGALGRVKLSVDVPVFLNNKVAYVLGVGMDSEQISSMLARQPFPDTWTASIIDTAGIVLTRTRNQEHFAGKLANPELVRRIGGPLDGAFNSVTQEGLPSLIIYSRSPLTGWTVAIAIPRAELEAPLIRTVTLATLVALSLLGVGVAMAWFMGGRIAGSVAALTGPARALETGETVVTPQVYFREAEDVARSMARTADLLAQRADERERAELALRGYAATQRAQDLFTEQLLAKLPIGVALRTLQGEYLEANAAFLAIVGRTHEQLVGLTNAQISPLEYQALDAAQMRLLLSTGNYGPYEKEYLRPDGSRVPVLLRGRRVEVADKTVLLSVAEDITARRKTEFQLAQSEKMNAIGQLTGGLAHDFNNMLGVIIGNLDLLLASVAGDAVVHSRLQNALSAALNGADLTRALLSVARSTAAVSELVDLNARIQELLPLIRHTAGGNVEVVVALSGSPKVVVDPGGLAATVLNLIINARDAMPGGGKLTISTRLREHAKGDGLVACTGDAWVELSVTDTGCGMAPDVLAQAMTPFFTTKERGRGTGLGLAMAHGFATKAGGELLLYSEPGHGTTVKLSLPESDALEAPKAGDGAAPDSQMPPTGTGNARILVVDDEIQLLAVTATWLMELGYSVTPCTSPAAALAALREQVAAGQPHDLMVTDIIMPGMDGFALAVAGRGIQPGLALLYVSGFADAADRGRDRPEGQILQKPYRKPELAQRVRAALEQSRQENP